MGKANKDTMSTAIIGDEYFLRCRTSWQEVLCVFVWTHAQGDSTLCIQDMEINHCLSISSKDCPCLTLENHLRLSDDERLSK